jgi:hypothetical protein
MISQRDFSIYTLPQLFKARYWTDTRSRSLEEEIQKRCTHIRERTNGELCAARGSSARFRPYGLICGAGFLLVFVGPFVAVKLLDAMKVIDAVDGDKGSLSGVWALFTLPVLVIAFVIGTMTDAERIVRWFNLDGRSMIR